MLDPNADTEVHMDLNCVSWSGAMFDHVCGQIRMDSHCRSLLRPVLLAGRETEQRTFGGRRILTAAHRELSSVAAHTAAQESRSTGIKTEQAREEGDVPNREQQKNSCPSRATSIGFGQGVGHLPVSVT